MDIASSMLPTTITTITVASTWPPLCRGPGKPIAFNSYNWAAVSSALRSVNPQKKSGSKAIQMCWALSLFYVLQD